MSLSQKASLCRCPSLTQKASLLQCNGVNYNLDMYVINPHADDGIGCGQCGNSPCIGGLWSYTDGSATHGEHYLVQEGCALSWQDSPATTGTISGTTITLFDGTTGEVRPADYHHGFNIGDPAAGGMAMSILWSSGYVYTRSTNADVCYTDPSLDSCDCLTGVGTQPGAFEVSRNKPATMGPGFNGANGIPGDGDEGDAALMVDGKRNAIAWGASPNTNSDSCDAPVYVTVDLEQNFVIDTVTIWSYWGSAGTSDARRYCSEKIAISETGAFTGEEVIIYDTGSAYGPPSGAAGHTVDGHQTLGRYVRRWSSRSEVNVGVHFIETKVMGREPSVYAQAQTSSLVSTLEALAPGTVISAADGDYEYTMTVAKAGCAGTCGAAPGLCLAGTYGYGSDWGTSGGLDITQDGCAVSATVQGESTTYGFSITSPAQLVGDGGAPTGTIIRSGPPQCASSITYAVPTTNSDLCGRPEGGTTITYTGVPCGDGTEILWQSMFSTNVRDELTASQCQWNAANFDPNAWVPSYTGTCGVAPTAVPNLPTSCTNGPVDPSLAIDWDNGYVYHLVTNDQWTLTQTNTATGGAPTSLGIWDGTGHGTGTLAFTGGDGTCNNGGGREASVNLISGGATSLTASEPQTCVRCPCRSPCRNRRTSCA